MPECCGSGAENQAVVAIAPVAGLPILDVCLVSYSRRRRGLTVMSGGRDHLTHRLRRRVGSARAMALWLATTQAALCTLALMLVRLDPAAVATVATACAGAGVAAILALERPAFAPLWSPAVEPAGAPMIAEGAAAEHLATDLPPPGSSSTPDQPLLIPAAQEQSA